MASTKPAIPYRLAEHLVLGLNPPRVPFDPLLYADSYLCDDLVDLQKRCGTVFQSWFSDTPRDQFESSIRTVNEIAQMVRELAHKAGIDSPVVILSSSHPFSASCCTLSTGSQPIPCVIVSAKQIANFNHMRCLSAARPDLQLTRDELYAALAHEVAHLKTGKQYQQPDMKDPTAVLQAKEHNHAVEHEADREAIWLGANPDALIRALLKTTHFRREEICANNSYKLDNIDDSPAHTAEEKMALRRATLSPRTQINQALQQGCLTHPPIKDRRDQTQESAKNRDFIQSVAQSIGTDSPAR